MTGYKFVQVQVSTDEASRLIEIYNHKDIVFPISVNGTLFTTGNLYSIDQHPSSTSSCDSFHGTAISSIQHMAHDNQKVPKTHQHNTSHQGSKIMMSLPER